MSEHSNGDGSSRNCNVSHVPLWMCTEVKMVLTLGDRVERMQNVNSLTDNLLQGPWSPAYYSFIVATRGFYDFLLCMQFSFKAGIVVVKSKCLHYGYRNCDVRKS